MAENEIIFDESGEWIADENGYLRFKIVSSGESYSIKIDGEVRFEQLSVLADTVYTASIPVREGQIVKLEAQGVIEIIELLFLRSLKSEIAVCDDVTLESKNGVLGIKDGGITEEKLSLSLQQKINGISDTVSEE